MCNCLRGVSRWFTPLACGPGSPELSKSYMDMASKLFTFTFTFTCTPYGRHSTPSCMASALCYPLHCVWWCTQHHACTIDRCYGSFLNVCTVETGHTAWEV